MNRLTINQRTTLSLKRFRYEVRSSDTGNQWKPVEGEKEHARMIRILANAYVNPLLTVRSMQTGVVGRTTFSEYRAIRIDGEES